jgi:hypothetical protein
MNPPASNDDPNPPNAEAIGPLRDALGAITMAWSLLEMTLSLILAELLETDHDTALLASAALDYRHRRDLINSLSAVKLYDNPRLQHVTTFMGNVKGMAGERNSAIHAMWGHDPHTGRLNRITIRNQGALNIEFKPMAPGHLNSVADKINALAKDGMTLAVMIRYDVKTWRNTNPPRIPPHLAHEAHRQESKPSNSPAPPEPSGM